MEHITKKDIVAILLEQGRLIDPEIIKNITDQEAKEILNSISQNTDKKDAINKLILNKKDTKEKTVKVISSFEESPHKKGVHDFTKLFNYRYDFLRKILQGRPELVNATSIRRIKERKAKEEATLICMVKSKRTTKSNNLFYFPF